MWILFDQTSFGSISKQSHSCHLIGAQRYVTSPRPVHLKQRTEHKEELIHTDYYYVYLLFSSAFHVLQHMLTVHVTVQQHCTSSQYFISLYKFSFLSFPAQTPRVCHLPAAPWPTACCRPALSTTTPPPLAAAATSRRGSRLRRS